MHRPAVNESHAAAPSPADLPARSTVNTDDVHLLPHTTYIPTALAHGIDFIKATGEGMSAAVEVVRLRIRNIILLHK